MKLFHIILIFLIANLSLSIHSSVKDSDAGLMDELKSKKQAVFRTPYLFGCKVFQDIADQLGFPFEQRVKTSLALAQRSEEVFDQMKVGAHSIPLNHHRMWFTSLENPVEMPASMMHFYLESLDRFSSSWKHFFWCLNPQDIPQTVKALADRGVVIVPVSEIYQKMIARALFDVYLAEGHFSLAANILKQEILNDRGGLYADAGVEILMDPRIFMGNYKYILSLKPTGEGNSYLDHDICAACPKSLLQGIFLGRLGKLQAMPDIFRAHLKSPESQVNLVRPPHLMLAIDEMLKGKSVSDAGFLFLDGGVLFNRNGQSTWAHGKFGSKPISNLTVNIFDVSIPPFYDRISRAWLDLWAPQGYISSVTQILYPETWLRLEKGIRQKRFGTFQAAQRRLLTLKEAARREGGIPLISHRIWITSSNDLHEVPDEFLKKYFQSLERQEGEWRHFFWCIDPERIPETIRQLQRAPKEIEVRRLSEIFPEMKGKFVFDFYMGHSLWALAKDIASYNIVWQWGGLYSDIGVELKENMSPYLGAFDNIFANNQFYPDMSFFGLRVRDSAFAFYLNYLEELKTRIPAHHQGWSLDRALDLHGAGGLIYFLDELMPPDTALLLVPDGSLFERNGTGSWKGREGKFGSRSVTNPVLQKTNFFKWELQESEGPRWWDYGIESSILRRPSPAQENVHGPFHMVIADEMVQKAARIEIPLGKLLQGGDDGLEPEAFSFLRASTPLEDTPHVWLLKEYKKKGEGVYAPETLPENQYYLHGCHVMAAGRSKRYFAAHTPPEILDQMRTFLSRFQNFDPHHDPIWVRPVQDSSFYTIIDGHHRAAMNLVKRNMAVQAIVVAPPKHTPLQALLLKSSWAQGEKILYQPIESPELEQWTLVRKCTDRFEMMRQFLQNQGVASTSDARRTFIDLGSNFGWFVRQFEEMGFQSYGLDRDTSANQVARLKVALKTDQIIEKDLVEGLRDLIKKQTTFDVVSCLSVLHHFVRKIRGNDGIMAEELLSLISKITKHIFFIDMGQDHEGVSEFTPEYIESWLKKHGNFQFVVSLGKDTDNIGKYKHAYARTLFACIKDVL